MNQLLEFAYLYNIPIPVKEYAEYYIHQYFRYKPEYKRYFEVFLDETDLKSFNYKESFKSNLNKVIEHFKSRIGFDKMKITNELFEDAATFNFFQSEEWANQLKHEETNKTTFISIDLESANFNLCRNFNKTDEYINQYFYHECLSIGVPSYLANSKAFRQNVFGQLNPGLINKLQIKIMRKLYFNLFDKTKKHFALSAINNDEIILQFIGDKSNLTIHQIKDEVAEIMKSTIKLELPFKVKIFYKEKISEETGWIEKVVQLENIELKKTLKGVPGDRFYYCLKEQIFGEKPDLLDKVFVNNGRKAMYI